MKTAMPFATSAAATLLLAALNASAADIGQIPPNPDPKIQQWFRDARSPRSGRVHCCDVADGHLVDFEIRADGYWVPVEGKMWHVPDDAVIVDSKNPFLMGVLWYRMDHQEGYDPTPYIRCFAPGGGL